MARFRGTLQGNRGQAARLGHPRDGLTANVNGWNGGVYVHLYVDADGCDRADITLTGGSHAHGIDAPLYSGRLDEATRAVLNGGKWVGTGLQTKTHREGGGTA